MQYRPTVIKVIDKICFTISLTLTQQVRFVTTDQSTGQGAACSTILQRKKCLSDNSYLGAIWVGLNIVWVFANYHMIVGGCTLCEYKTFIMVLSIVIYNSSAVNLVCFFKNTLDTKIKKSRLRSKSIKIMQTVRNTVHRPLVSKGRKKYNAKCALLWSENRLHLVFQDAGCRCGSPWLLSGFLAVLVSTVCSDCQH